MLAAGAAAMVRTRMSSFIATTATRSAGVSRREGLSATTLVARPRRASSSAIHPPRELPATWTRPSASRSSSASTASARAATVGLRSTSGGAVPNPGRSSARTSCAALGAGSTGFQERRLKPSPWMRSRGSPAPSRTRVSPGAVGARARRRAGGLATVAAVVRRDCRSDAPGDRPRGSCPCCEMRWPRSWVTPGSREGPSGPARRTERSATGVVPVGPAREAGHWVAAAPVLGLPVVRRRPNRTPV